MEEKKVEQQKTVGRSREDSIKRWKSQEEETGRAERVKQQERIRRRKDSRKMWESQGEETERTEYHRNRREQGGNVETEEKRT